MDESRGRKEDDSKLGQPREEGLSLCPFLLPCIQPRARLSQIPSVFVE